MPPHAAWHGVSRGGAEPSIGRAQAMAMAPDEAPDIGPSGAPPVAKRLKVPGGGAAALAARRAAQEEPADGEEPGGEEPGSDEL
jgi:hypothetical protein